MLMRHSNALIALSFANKHLNKYLFRTTKNIHFKNNERSQFTKFFFSESSFGSREFKSGDNSVPFVEHIKQSINKFPYCKLPKYTQRFSEQKQLEPEDYEKLVAFGCLFVVNESKKQRQLKQMGQILLKQKFESFKNETLSGSQIFYLYYISKLPQMIKQITKEEQISEQTVTFYLQVMSNLLPTTQVKNYIQQLQQQKFSRMNSHIQSLYVKLLLKHQLPSINAIDKLYNSLTNKDSQGEQKEKMNLEAAKALVSIQNYEYLLSDTLKDEALKIITENITKMQAVDHIEVIKHIYMSKSPMCKTYIDNLTNEIVKLHQQKRGQELHVPLMLKVIKYRSKLHVQNNMFLDIINSYPQKFNTVFREKNINKEIFLSLTTKQASTHLNMEIKTEFGSYIQKIFNQYENKQELDEEELIRNIKLILKYGNDIKNQQLTQVFKILVDNLYERTKHAASDELKYYIFLVCYTFNTDQTLKISGITEEVVKIYHNKCLNQPSSDSISKIINIEYQLCRKQAESSLRMNIFQYNYANLELQSSVYSYLFYLMKKQKSKGSNGDKVQVLTQLKKNIFRNLSHGNFSIKIIYTLVDVLDELNYMDKYLYTDIERAIGRHLQKALSSDNKKYNQMLLPKDISFLKNKMTKNDKCSTKFTTFLTQCQKNYNLINDYAREYVQKSKNWQNIRENFKRNRERDDKKSPKTGGVEFKPFGQKL